MSAGLVAQYAVIAVLVMASALYTLRRLAPKAAARAQAAWAASLLRPQRGALAHRLGRFVQPKGATGNCGDGCGTCGTCGPAGEAETDGAASEQPLTFHPPRK
ncbi:DUF6587 family protein [Paraburkholderia acidipaludis]|uniref:DUF6587 family protein n=1 Tax=Paraburkholderia acidipaludis TaxID=660537 RepID=UPI000486659E|nr:DUF6587 family protein [Paraburkholderia acidipaludis]